MKSLSIIAPLLLLTIQLHGQIISGKVIDVKSGVSLVYVSIGIINTPNGTITDEKGNFNLEITGQSPKARVRFSMIGYNAQTFSIEELANKENVIKLKVESTQLAEVVIKPGNKRKKVGITNFSRYGGVCGWSGTDFGKGHEIGTKIDLGSVPVKLQSLHIRVHKQSFDSSLFRLHIRTILDNLPHTELLKENILITVTETSGWVNIDLSKYNLVFEGEIALTLEWIKVIGLHKDKFIKLNDSEHSAYVVFNVKNKQGCIYNKRGVENKWIRSEIQSPSFYLTIQD